MKLSVADKSYLDSLIASGAVWVDEYGQALGTASDGTKVTFGLVDAETVAYLREHPTPDTW